MAKVTITITDKPNGRITIDGNFEHPGKTYAEMIADPTQAVAAGIALIAAMTDRADSYTGVLTDDDGTQRPITPKNPL